MGKLTTPEISSETHKKRKSQQDVLNTDDVHTDLTTSAERKPKKRKKQGDDNPEEADSIKLKEKRERKTLRREAAGSLDNRTDNGHGQDLGEANDKEDGERVKNPEGVKRKSKKEKMWLKRQAAANAGDLEPHKDPAGEGKEEVEILSAVETAPEPAKKKKHTNRTGYPDPNEDASLSEQARKALAYAFEQFHRPSKWKFHKARQNWIIRNVLSSESIPEAYFPLVTAYLAKVQGGVRENLLKHCRISLEPPKAEDLPPETTTPDTLVAPIIPKPPPAIDPMKLARAKTMIHTLDANQATDG